jgi:hypothetical protein
MGGEPRGVLIVGLGDGADVEEIKRRVSAIDGVLGVDFNHLTQRLLVRYGGDSGGTRDVESEIKKVLEAERGGDRKRSRHVRGKKRR